MINHFAVCPARAVVRLVQDIVAKVVRVEILKPSPAQGLDTADNTVGFVHPAGPAGCHLNVWGLACDDLYLFCSLLDELVPVGYPHYTARGIIDSMTSYHSFARAGCKHVQGALSLL